MFEIKLQRQIETSLINFLVLSLGQLYEMIAIVEGLVVSFPSTNGTNINEPMKRSVQHDTLIMFVNENTQN